MDWEKHIHKIIHLFEVEGARLWKCGSRHAWNTQSKYKAWAIKCCSCDFKPFAPDCLKNKEILEILYNLYIIQQPLLLLMILQERWCSKSQGTSLLIHFKILTLLSRIPGPHKVRKLQEKKSILLTICNGKVHALKRTLAEYYSPTMNISWGVALQSPLYGNFYHPFWASLCFFKTNFFLEWTVWSDGQICIIPAACESLWVS